MLEDKIKEILEKHFGMVREGDTGTSFGNITSELAALYPKESEIRAKVLKQIRGRARYTGCDNCGYYTINLADWESLKAGAK